MRLTARLVLDVTYEFPSKVLKRASALIHDKLDEIYEGFVEDPSELNPCELDILVVMTNCTVSTKAPPVAEPVVLPLRWTKDRPKVSGYYFVERNDVLPDKLTWEIVQVISPHAEWYEPFVYVVDNTGCRIDMTNTCFVRWSDRPITKPID